MMNITIINRRACGCVEVIAEPTSEEMADRYILTTPAKNGKYFINYYD